jgi:hypothetical protein
MKFKGISENQFFKFKGTKYYFSGLYFETNNAELISFPLTDHYFAKSGSKQEAFDKFSGGQIQQLFDEYNPAVGTSAVNWSNK